MTGDPSCFFCSGHLPCRDHKPRDFADLDFQEYVMGEIDGRELFERQGVDYDAVHEIRQDSRS